MKKIFSLIPLLFATSGTSTPPQYVQLTEHDAVGRTQQATAVLNDFNYNCANGTCTLYVYYFTDQLFCSAFGPGQ